MGTQTPDQPSRVEEVTKSNKTKEQDHQEVPISDMHTSEDATTLGTPILLEDVTTVGESMKCGGRGVAHTAVNTSQWNGDKHNSRDN